MNLNIDDFLHTYWQKQPVVLSQLFSDFPDPISPEELAGLAMEEWVSSRIITSQGVEHGPFDDFSQLDQNGASLLVQAVNHWHEGSAQLFDQFRFIPNWRLDDLMVSYSMPQGSVGAHIDQYDVFIIQGMGKRVWRVGAPLNSEQALTYQHGQDFESVIEVVMQPGDALYIPPNCPHQGVTIETCMNYSIGFRAPSVSESLTRLADQLLDLGVNTPRFSDLDRKTSQASPGMILSADLSRIQQLLSDYVFSDAGRQLLLKQLSEQQREMDLPDAPNPFSIEEVSALLASGAELKRAQGLIPLYFKHHATIEFYIQGQLFTLSLENEVWIQRLCDSSSFVVGSTECNKMNVEFLTILSNLLSNGYWYLTD